MIGGALVEANGKRRESPRRFRRGLTEPCSEAAVTLWDESWNGVARSKSKVRPSVREAAGMTHRHAAHAAIRNPADGLLHIAVTPEGGAARNNRPVSGLASLDASPSRKVRAHRPRAMPRCPSSGWRFLRNRRDASALTYRCGGSRGIAAVCRAPRSRFTRASAEARAPVANIRRKLSSIALPDAGDANQLVLSQGVTPLSANSRRLFSRPTETPR